MIRSTRPGHRPASQKEIDRAIRVGRAYWRGWHNYWSYVGSFLARDPHVPTRTYLAMVREGRLAGPQPGASDWQSVSVCMFCCAEIAPPIDSVQGRPPLVCRSSACKVKLAALLLGP